MKNYNQFNPIDLSSSESGETLPILAHAEVFSVYKASEHVRYILTIYYRGVHQK